MKVAVVGGGIAGILSSKWLSEREIDGEQVAVDMFEMQSRENYSVHCGDILAGIHSSAELLPGLYTKHLENNVEKAKYVFDNKEYEIQANLGVINRESWQRDLISELEDINSDSVCVHFNSRREIRDLENSEYDLVVDARGSIPSEDKDTGKAVYAVCEGSFDDDIVYQYNLDGLAGYYWIIPYSSNLANIGYGGEVKEDIDFSGLEPLLEKANVDEIKERGAGFLDYTYSSELYFNSDTPDLVSVNDFGTKVVKVGDAAGLVGTFTGGGVDRAIVTAKLLSRTVEDIVKHDKSVYDYEEKVYSTLSDFLIREAKLAYMRRNEFSNFEKAMSIFNGLNIFDINGVRFALRHPIKSLRLGLTMR